jgi:hypothetical protein
VSAGGPTVVLVHSPLVGASAWEPVADVLRARGRTAVVPALAEAFNGAAPYCPRLAATVARQLDGHGGEGRAGEGQHALGCLDALRPGQHVWVAAAKLLGELQVPVVSVRGRRAR